MKESELVKLVEYDPSTRAKRLGRHRPSFPTAPPQDSVNNMNEAKLSMFRFDSQPVRGPGSRGGKRSVTPRGVVTSQKLRTKDMEKKQMVFGRDGKLVRDEDQGTQEKQDQERQSEINQAEENKDNQNVSSQNVSSQNVGSHGNHQLGQNVGYQNDSQMGYQNDSQVGYQNDSQSYKEGPQGFQGPYGFAHNEGPGFAGPSHGYSGPSHGFAQDRGLQGNFQVHTQQWNLSKLPQPSWHRIVPVNEANKEHIKTDAVTEAVKTGEGVNGKAGKQKSVVPLSRTTICNNHNRISRQLPGPLVPLGYELYNESTMKKNTELALGFPVQQFDIAQDIIFITQFLLKFHHIIGETVSPQQLEGLAHGEPVDETIVRLFVKLMGLVLNRKRAIIAVGTAITELRGVMAAQGAPQHWRTDTEIPEPVEDTTGELLDPSKPEILPQPIFPPSVTMLTYDVFEDGQFEEYGLEGIQPAVERLTIIKLLCQWSLSCSEVIKHAVHLSVQGQDIPGDKDTYYAPRSIMNGFASTQEVKAQAEKKLAKREDDVKYVDPTSDPTQHCYRLRLDELVVGDCGARIGRFYLCRMANAENGGLGSVEQMKAARDANCEHLPTGFVLYVEDVHQMLLEGLGRGEEGAVWYRVAGNVEELERFVEYCGERAKGDERVGRMVGYLGGLVGLLKRQESERMSEETN